MPEEFLFVKGSCSAEEAAELILSIERGDVHLLPPYGHPENAETVRSLRHKFGIRLGTEILGTIVAVGHSGIEGATPNAKTALRNIRYDVEASYEWWIAACRSYSLADLVAFFKGLVIGEREFGWMGGSASPIRFVFNELVRQSKGLYPELLDWALRNRGTNVWTPLGFQTRARNLDEWRAEREGYRRRDVDHWERMKRQASDKLARLLRASEMSRLHCERAAERKRGRLHLILELQHTPLQKRFQKFSAQTEFPMWALPEALFPMEMIPVMSVDDQVRMGWSLTDVKGHWRLLGLYARRQLAGAGAEAATGAGGT